VAAGFPQRSYYGWLGALCGGKMWPSTGPEALTKDQGIDYLPDCRGTDAGLVYSKDHTDALETVGLDLKSPKGTR